MPNKLFFNPGDLRESVTIQQATRTADSAGGFTETWSTFAAVYASVEPLLGRTKWMAEQAMSEVTAKVRIRYLAGVTPGMQLVHGSTTYHIISVADAMSRNREMVLDVKVIQ